MHRPPLDRMKVMNGERDREDDARLRRGPGAPEASPGRPTDLEQGPEGPRAAQADALESLRRLADADPAQPPTRSPGDISTPACSILTIEQEARQRGRPATCPRLLGVPDATPHGV